MQITAGDRTWSTGGNGDDAIIVGQAFRDGERWLIDATDPNIKTWSPRFGSTVRMKMATWRSPAR
jgi:hypothetical protein